MPADYTTPTYTAPSSSGSTDWYDLIRLGLAYKQYQDSKKPPKFADVPQSPEQKAILEMYMGSMGNPALKNNAAMVNQRASDILGSYKDLSWQSPKTFNGQVGYAGTRSPYATGTPIPTTAQFTGRPAQGSAVNREDVIPAGSGSAARAGGGVQPFNRMTNIDGGNTIPGARAEMQEQSWERNVGMPGYTTGTAPRGTDPSMFAQGRMPDTWGGPGGQMEFGSASDLRDSASAFAKFLTANGVRDGMKVALGFFAGGLSGAALAAAKVLYERWQSTERGPLPQSGATLPQGPGVRP